MVPSNNVSFSVLGVPAPQGSKRFVGVSKAGRGILIDASKRTKPWRLSVQAAAEAAGKRVEGAVSVMLTFTMPKPKSAPKTRVTLPDKKPDIDKLCRSTLDGLVDAGVIEDDARVVSLAAFKRFPNEGESALEVPGCVVVIWQAGNTGSPARV